MPYDVLVIGGGPAGLSAAVNVRIRGRSVLVVSNPPEENPLWRAERVDNYLGLPGRSGPELLTEMRRHAESAGVEFLTGKVLTSVRSGKLWYVSVGTEMYAASALVLAAGVARGKKFPGEAELLGKGVSYCATCDGMLYRGKRAAVIGLAADAPAEADFLREIGCDVHYYDGKKHRFEIRGAERADTLVVDGAAEPADVIFVLRAGFAADTLLPGLATEKGHIVVDEAYAASIPGVFAAGDCTGAPYQIPAAVGEGNCAALSVVRWLRNA